MVYYSKIQYDKLQTYTLKQHLTNQQWIKWVNQDILNNPREGRKKGKREQKAGGKVEANSKMVT